MTEISQDLIDTWVIEAQKEAKRGQLPSYIPRLQKINPDRFSLYILGLNQVSFQGGDLSLIFPLMSVIKPFLLLYLLVKLGEERVFKSVGHQPSDYPFNSLEQLQQDQGFPRNPMINSGAIMLSSLIEGETAELRCEKLRQWLNKIADINLFLDEKMLESVTSKPNLKNQALLQELSQKNNLQDPKITLDTYNRICCLSGTVIDVAKLGLILINSFDHQVKKSGVIVQEIMSKAGLYEASKSFQNKINFPTKSGISGIVLSLIPQKNRVIAVYSPLLDKAGNSRAGLYLIEKIAFITSLEND